LTVSPSIGIASDHEQSQTQTYAPQARKDFIAAVEARANLLGLSEKSGTLDIAASEKKGDVAVIAGQAWPAKVHDQRQRLIKRMKKDGFAQTVEAVAYTWFNRFAALRLHGDPRLSRSRHTRPVEPRRRSAGNHRARHRGRRQPAGD
jgi:hypothetical protein